MHDRLAVNILRKPLAYNPIINDRYKMLSRSYASNCVGHQVLATHLLPLMKRTIAQGKASKGRIAAASSSLHSLCRELDLNLLTSPTYPKPPSIDGVWRYARAKVGTILFTRELKRRLLQEEDSASSKVYVDASFPGNIVTDQWSVWDKYVGEVLGSLLRRLFSTNRQSRGWGCSCHIFSLESKGGRERRSWPVLYSCCKAVRHNSYC
ncbi:hypothetical protein BDV23DRAFT_164296 [Aspergillus alliaceus]|uniref:Uncharacterized protein n=1 Tax=Petromyces alliaceus TaxID=209559 RepID=A0A5N7BWI8_PETAA|nr:hypothetical protein BDV23DRAFT_164296 [Aspergillus alliaceus]